MQKESIFLIKVFSVVILLFTLSCAGEKKASVSGPEKCWALRHPFVYKKAYRCSREAVRLTDSVKKTNQLDGDADGGQLDAFRHSCWMAITCRQIGYRRALGLGRAHEKGNYKSFLKKKTD